MNNVYDDKKLQKAFEEGYTQGRREGKEITACVEAELSQKCEKLKAENIDLRREFESMETEFVRMRAQLDIVYLIFGGKQ